MNVFETYWSSGISRTISWFLLKPRDSALPMNDSSGNCVHKKDSDRHVSAYPNGPH
jgi:hypothetical protein